jgi:ubiquinone/menaquinone biosynthesis C-methylase UbiE/uncharacterized protein YbaR (Trm112 family)
VLLRPGDVAHLACPLCKSTLTFKGAGRSGLFSGALHCQRCLVDWPVRNGLARLYRESEVSGNDRLLRYIYDGLPSLHDPAVRLLLPLLQAGSERALRDGYMRRLELSALSSSGDPVRILEIGIGAGANLKLLRRDLPRALPVEIWGCDLSEGMLSVLRRHQQRNPDPSLRLLMADAHALPFADAAFDRVFHVGGIGGYRNPSHALAEMGRVAKPDTPIVVVDEQLDPSQAHSLYYRAAFRAVTFYDSNPHCPVEHLPPRAQNVITEQVSRFFYCLTFRMPAA